MKLADIRIGQVVTVEHVGGEGSFRRRLMELGLVPGTRVEVLRVAPLGDPVELLVRGASLSIRKAEAEGVRVRDGLETEVNGARTDSDPKAAADPASGLVQSAT